MARLILFSLWLTMTASAAALADEVKLGDDITTGVQTQAEFEV
jgi:hypothetical protein